MAQNTPTPAASGKPTAGTGQAGGRHGLTESQDPQAAALRAEREGQDRAGAEHEMRVRSNYQTPLGDVAAVADARTRSDSQERDPREPSP
jgi:hypothetical protein